MQKQQPIRRSTSGAKAIALDVRKSIARYRLFLFISLLFSAVLALGLRLFFGH
ncbi:MAG TPA: hypothetical protein VH593_19710 [Ktedonobacteraceae bacterium]